MAHISYTRQVQFAHRTSIGEIVPANLELNNFAIFCGHPQQRVALATHAISRYAGRIGVVVIHDDNMIVNQISQLPRLLNNPDLQVRSDRGKVYDPLYGMSASAIVDLLAPMDLANPMSQNISTLRSAILAYLDIMKYQFSQGAGPFGDYPYNLNLLLQLTAMSYSELNCRVLQYLPPKIVQSIDVRINDSHLQQQVYSCVANLAATMQEYLWQPRDFAGHSCISIIDSVVKRQVICLRVPHAHTPLFNYIDAELKVLSNQNIPFLLVNCSLNISSHRNIQNWFLDAQAHKSYYTAIITSSVSDIVSDKDQRSKIFSHYQQIFVYQCAAVEQAEPFSAQYGQYYRLQTELQVGRSRRPFHLFSSHEQSNTQRYIAEPNIRPEDLTDRPNGLLLCGSAYRLPILIDYFDTTGGINNGTLLP